MIVHFHSLLPDWVFELDGAGAARFVPPPPPQDEEVEAILWRIVRRVAKALVDYGEDLESESDALAALQAAEVDRRLRYPDPFPHQRRSAMADGFSLHAGVRIHENDRQGLERLCRYLLRPPLALERLSRGEDGRLIYRLKRPKGGSLFLVLTPQELVARMATLVPPPRVHGVRYHGLFAPHAKERSRVVPATASEPATISDPSPSDQPHPQALLNDLSYGPIRGFFLLHATNGGIDGTGNTPPTNAVSNPGMVSGWVF